MSDSSLKPFHTDTVNDCLCLFVESLAASGGRSVLASSWTVYNELAATRPDLLHVLSQPDWPFDTYVITKLSRSQNNLVPVRAHRFF